MSCDYDQLTFDEHQSGMDAKLGEVAECIEGWELVGELSDQSGRAELIQLNPEGPKLSIKVIGYSTWQIELYGIFNDSPKKESASPPEFRIRVSLRRRTDIVARDIQRRIIKDYVPAYFEHKRKIDASGKTSKRLQEFTQGLCKLYGLSPGIYDNEVSGIVKVSLDPETEPKETWMKVQATSSSDGSSYVKLVIRTLPVAVFNDIADRYFVKR